jgi:dihydroneopterin triphosphate diphosphatase
MGMVQHFKIPESVLVVVYTTALEVLLIERADAPGFWQSVTGSKDTWDEPFEVTAAREVREETGLESYLPDRLLSDWGVENVYEIYPVWRAKYAPGVTQNRERVFGLRLAQTLPVQLNPLEHVAHQWLPWLEAILLLPSTSKAVGRPRP